MIRPLRRLLLTVLILSLSSFTLTGCWDRIEVNDIAIVLASAFDKTEDGQYRVSVQMALPGNMGGQGGGGGGTSGDKGFYVDSGIGKTIREANDKLQTRLSRRLFYSHRRVLVIGEELAKEGIREVFDVVARVPENRLTANIVVAKGDGITLLQAQPQFERFSAEAMREIVESEGIVSSRMKDVAHEMSQIGYDPMIPYLTVAPQQGESGKQKRSEVQFVGYAQFHSGKMVGVYEGEAMKGATWLRPVFYPYSTTADLKGIGKATLNIFKGSTNISPVLKKDHLHFYVKVEAKAYVLEAMSSMDLGIDSNVRKLEKRLREQMKESIQMALEQIRENETDVAGLGMLVSRTYPKKWSTEYRDHWYEDLKKATFDVAVDVKVTRIGLITENIAKREEVPNK